MNLIGNNSMYGKCYSLIFFDLTVADVNTRCIAHVVNLATQLLLNTYSKSKYYDPTNPNQDLLLDLEQESRDEIGLVRTISIKVSSITPPHYHSHFLLRSRRDRHQNARRSSSTFNETSLLIPGTPNQSISRTTCPFGGRRLISCLTVRSRLRRYVVDITISTIES